MFKLTHSRRNASWQPEHHFSSIFGKKLKKVMMPFVEKGCEEQEDAYAAGKNLILYSHCQEQLGILTQFQMHMSSVPQSYFSKCILRISRRMCEVS